MKDIKNHQFVQQLIKNGADVYIVGGYVRDHFLNLKSKDIDLLVQNLTYTQIEKILTKYGKVNLVGESFGVLKFTSLDSTLEYDIALPRKEQKNNQSQNAHKSFDINSDPFLPVDQDLARRDFTINSMAYWVNKDRIIDPFNGMDDIKNKCIRPTSPQTFIDDPLRMLRAIQFASRFGFKIEDVTKLSIKIHADKITGISTERVLIELDKIYKKGNIKYGLELLNATTLKTYIAPNSVYDADNIDKYHTTMSYFDFILAIFNYETDEFYKYMSKLPDIVYVIKQIHIINKIDNIADARHKLYQIKTRNSKYFYSLLTSIIFETNPMLKKIKNTIKDYPYTYNELKISAIDLRVYGFEGKELGDKIIEILKLIYKNCLKNKKETIKQYAQRTGV